MFDSMNRAIYQTIEGIKTLHLSEKSVKFCSFHVRLTIRVLYQLLNPELYMCVKVMSI